MDCKHHPEKSASAICRVCSTFLCNECRIEAARGYVCSLECKRDAETIDKILEVQNESALSKSLDKQFMLAAVVIVVGFLLMGERPLFGTESSTTEVYVGVMIMILGIGWAIKILYVKKKIKG